MNALFVTQSSSLRVFYDVANAMKSKGLKKTGFYIAESSFYAKFKKENPEICAGDYEVLKEWEIIEEARTIKPDVELLKAYEKKYGDPVLWNMLMGDRYIFLGRMASIKQDYSSRYGHAAMLAILQVAISKLESLFDRVKPDVVISFICATVGDYAAYQLAKNRSIQFLNLRPTRIKNFFIATEGVLEPSRRLETAYRTMLRDGVSGNLAEEVSSCLTEVRRSHAMYEGVVPPSLSQANKVQVTEAKSRKSLALKLADMFRICYAHNFGGYRHDNYYQGAFYPRWFKAVERPIRKRKIHIALKRRYVDQNKLASTSYAFYPLHKEPEVTLLVYSRPYVNQIEVVRNFARSLPVDMKLIVKEHPASVGYRPLSYYRKLLAIPNVLLAHPSMEARTLIQDARLVTIVCGSVGLEAVMMKKPVVVLGCSPFAVLPKTMVCYCREIDNLAWDIQNLLENHTHDENALTAYVAAIMRISVRVDFYSRLLGRTGVYRENAEDADDEQSKRKEQIQTLADYLLSSSCSETTC